jgi:PAS domain-containing protein
MHDFALNDPLIDLLHVLNNQEITTQELNESLVIIKAQKDKFQKIKKNRLSIVASANDNGIVFTRANGTIFWCNDAYLKLTGFQARK